MFKKEHDSLFNKDKEYHLSELMIKYETEKTQNPLKEQDIALMKKERRLQFLYLTVFFIVITAVVLFVSIHKRNKRHLNIVRQNLYLVEQEKILQNISKKTNIQENVGAGKYASSSLTEGKSEDLYLKLHQMMIRDKLYKDSSLTKERLANILDTNRAYLSQVINKHTRLSFNHYINRLRIEEVRRILSDPEDDTPLKAIASDTGFNNLATFYNAFQSVIGMPPSAYRAKMLEIFRDKQKGGLS
jgi:YesN/AraC family two-component response regulator